MNTKKKIFVGVALLFGLIFDARWLPPVRNLAESVNRANIVAIVLGTILCVFCFAVVSGFAANVWYRTTRMDRTEDVTPLAGFGFNLGAILHYLIAILITFDLQAVVFGVFHLSLIFSDKITKRIERW